MSVWKCQAGIGQHLLYERRTDSARGEQLCELDFELAKRGTPMPNTRCVVRSGSFMRKRRFVAQWVRIIQDGRVVRRSGKPPAEIDLSLSLVHMI